MNIAFIGFGQMGRPMAINLLRAHPGLKVHTPSGRAYAELQGLGAVPTDDRRTLADSDLVFLSLPDHEVVNDVLFGVYGVAQWMRPGSTVVDTSTMGHQPTLDIAARLAALDIRFIDAPVSGMPHRASEGSLTAMCGGSEAVFNEVVPYLQSMAPNILYMGGSGSGQLTKLINQLLFDINCAALAEILPMSLKLGLDPEKVTAVVSSGTGRSHASEFFVPHILANEFNNGYPLKDAYKDLVSGAELSARMGIPLPVLAAATTTYQTALLQGHGDEDKGAMIKVYERLLDVKFRTASTPAATASVLLNAWHSGELLDQLPAEVKPETLEQGYDAQDALFKGAAGVRAGWKLGVGSPAAMRAAQLLRPLVGQLEKMRLHASGAHLHLPGATPVTIECEIAFVLDRDIPPQPGRTFEPEDIRSTCVTFEVVRSRFTDRKTVGWPSFAADNVGFEALVVGPSICTGLDVHLMRELAQTAVVHLDGAPRAKGLFGDTATDPLASLAALYQHAAERGETIRAGDIVTTGAMCEPFDIRGEGHGLSVEYFGKQLTFSL